MKVLWLSSQPLMVSNVTNSYNGGGWIESMLYALKAYKSDVNIAVAYPSKKESKSIIDDVSIYTIMQRKLSSLSKLFYYWGGYKKRLNVDYNNDIHRIIEDFKPDVIHLWGTESALASIIGHTHIPIVVHMQGILSPYANAFFSQTLGSIQIKRNSFLKENIFRNGYDFAYKSIKLRAKVEEIRMQNIKYSMGRTHWDKQLVKLYAPHAQYFHVDEVLRETFYCTEKQYNHKGKLVITTTISQTIYKGLDVVLKSANLLKRLSTLDFEWRVVGINANCDFVKLFEKITGIDSSSVNVKYMGILDQNKLMTNLLDSSVYVHPSYIDNSPNSLCEAQIVGLPSVACNVGGVASLIEHGVTGYLVPSNAPHEIAYYLRTLAENTEQMANMGNSARVVALKRHNKETIVRSLLNVYREIMANNK